MINTAALISKNIPRNKNNILIFNKKTALLLILLVIKLDKKLDTPDIVMALPATVEKAFNRPIAAVDAPLIAATSQREILIAFLSIIFRIIK